MYGGHLVLDVSLGNPEELILTLVQQLGHIEGVLINHVLDHGGCTYQLTLDILLEHYPGVVFNVGCRDNLRGKLSEIYRAAGLLKLIHPLELTGYSKQVYRLITLVEFNDRGKYLLVRSRIKHLGAEHVNNHPRSLYLKHGRSEHRLFHLRGLRGYPATLRNYNHLLLLILPASGSALYH